MKFAPNFIELSEAKYNDLVFALTATSFDCCNYLDSIELPEFLAFNNSDQYLIIKRLHDNLMLFADIIVKEKLKRLDLKEQTLRWFISLDNLKTQFILIENEGIQIDKYHLLNSIKTHLNYKFSHDLLLWNFNETTSYDNITMTSFSRRLHQIKNRRKYGDGSLKIINNKNASEATLQNILNANFSENLELVTILSKGKTEPSLLKTIIEEYFDYDTKKISLTKFLSSIYELFKIIMPDYNFPSEEEYLDTNNYENNYNTYKAKKLKKYILSK